MRPASTPPPRPRLVRRLPALMALEALTLAVASALHLSGQVHGSPPFDPDHAGVAEAIIGAVLLGGAIAMVRAPARARAVGLAANGFATVGFLVGLSFTARGGHAPDVVYHVVLLPVLVASLVALARSRPERPGAPPAPSAAASRSTR